MTALAEKYISSHKEARKVIDEQPNSLLAYTYLENKWRAWNEKNAQFSEREAEGNLLQHFDSLTHYFANLASLQEELIEMTTVAARKTLLAEGLLTALDQNKIIHDKATLENTVDKTISVLFPRDIGVLSYHQIPPGLLKAVAATQSAHSESSKIASSAALRGQIQAWVRHDFKSKSFNDYAVPIAEFTKFRTKLAIEINRYQEELLTLESNLRAVEQSRSPAMPLTDTDTVVRALRRTVTNRIAETEDFRNGLLEQLPPQPDMLNGIKLNNADLRRSISKSILRSAPNGNDTLSVKDIPPLFRNMKDPVHPLVNHIENVRQRLDTACAQSDNQLYHKELRSVAIKENGPKSWKRTIDKLEELHFDWNRLRDVNRVNVLFNEAGSLFFFNQVIRDLASNRQWEIASPNEKGAYNRDRGITMQGTGSWNWHVNMAKKLPDGNHQVCEVKLDDLSQYKAEMVSHKIYECARLLQADDHSFNLDRLTPEHYAEFHNFTKSTINSLLTHKKMFPEEQEGFLIRISALLDSPPNITLAPALYELLLQADIVNRASAAQKSAPTMAALYDIKFKEMAGKDPQSHGWRMQLYDSFGPRQTNGTTGQYQPHHKDMCATLIKDWQQGWKAQQPQKTAAR